MFLNKIRSNINNIPDNLLIKEIGIVSNVNDSIILVTGLKSAEYEECVVIADKYYGYVVSIDEHFIKVVMLDDTKNIMIGNEVKRTKKQVQVPVGDDLIGRVVDGLGRALDDSVIHADSYLPIERPSKSILDRQEVNFPLFTGIKIIDCLIPIGRGQRELILGDRQTGKTSIAIDTILNQKRQNVICIYCAIGQRDSQVRNIIDVLQKNDAMDYTIIVDASATSPAGLQIIAPFTATSIAEYFCEKGKNVLVVYDDLTKHARAYREVSLLLERAPGREAYPGDIFYLHSRLLERSINMLDGGSITSLPIIETEEENVSAYIPTNVISITDGQIYLSPSNYNNGILPAIEINKSVSRVGSKAQLQAIKQMTASIGVNYAQFQEVESFSKFSTKLDDKTRMIISKGQIIREFFKQDRFKYYSHSDLVALLICINNNLFNSIKKENIKDVEKDIIDIMDKDFSIIVKAINSNKKIMEESVDKFAEKCAKIINDYNNK